VEVDTTGAAPSVWRERTLVMVAILCSLGWCSGLIQKILPGP
jgi:hypothetical protein